MSKENLENEEFENEEEWTEGEVEVYTLEDEDGNESEFALIKRMDIEGQSYVAFEPFDENDDSQEDDEEDSFVILKVVNEGGEEVFVTIEDDDEFDRVADIFEDELMEEISESEEE